VGAVPLPAVAPSLASGFRVGFVGRDGVDQRLVLADAAGCAFEDVAPVRSFPSFRGQRNNTGWWWCGTNRDHVIRLDFAAEVVGLASQPFWLTWDDGRRGRRHAPDYFARLADGTGLVIDCRPAGRIKPADAAAFAATERACAEIGWRYELAHEPDPVRMANLRWLAGYRRDRCRRVDIAAAALERAVVPHRLLDLAQVLGDPLATLPVIFHLLWCSELETNLSLPLHENSVVAVPLSAGQRR
jgi:hypothetical protein